MADADMQSVDRADSAYNERLGAWGQAVALAGKYFDEDQVASLESVSAKTRGRLRHGTQHTVVAIAGATGSGKSSIVNRLAGRELTAVSYTHLTLPTNREV